MGCKALSKDKGRVLMPETNSIMATRFAGELNDQEKRLIGLTLDYDLPANKRYGGRDQTLFLPWDEHSQRLLNTYAPHSEETEEEVPRPLEVEGYTLAELRLKIVNNQRTIERRRLQGKSGTAELPKFFYFKPFS